VFFVHVFRCECSGGVFFDFFEESGAGVSAGLGDAVLWGVGVPDFGDVVGDLWADADGPLDGGGAEVGAFEGGPEGWGLDCGGVPVPFAFAVSGGVVGDIGVGGGLSGEHGGVGWVGVGGEGAGHVASVGALFFEGLEVGCGVFGVEVGVRGEGVDGDEDEVAGLRKGLGWGVLIRLMVIVVGGLD